MAVGGEVIGTAERRMGGRAVAYALLLCLGCACIAAALCWRWANLPPNVPVSTVVVPKKNAYDYWRSAISELNGTDARLLDDLAAARRGGTAGGRDLPAGERSAILARSGAVLRDIDWGLRYPYVEPPHPAGPNTFSHYYDFRMLARLLRLDGQDGAAKGIPAGAVSRVLDGIQMGVEIPHESPNIGLLVGADIQQEARSDVWAQVPRLSAKEARAAAARLERICARQAPYWQTLEAEKRYTVTELQAILQEAGWRGNLQRFGLTSSASSPFAKLPLRLRMATISKTEFVGSYAAHVDRVIALAKGPYPGGAVNFPRAPETVAESLTPFFDLARFLAAKEESLNSLLLLTFALRAYHAEHGRYPATLAELAPKTLKRIPADPFDPKLGFRYARTGATYRLYSVGPDLADDGGTPARSRTTSIRGQAIPAFKVERESTGDLVPGVSL